MKNTARWTISASVLNAFTGEIQKALGFMEQLNGSLNDIRIVTKKSANDMKDFAKEANKAAKELKTTTTEYTNASLIYYQQGLSDDEVKRRTDLTIQAAKAAGVATDQMSEYLTAVWNSYDVSGKDLEKYVDIMAKVGAATATSLEEISTSMTKVAATGRATGVTMEQMTAMVATTASVTRQAPEMVGTAYKTIFARTADLKLGKTLDDGVTLGNVSSGLKKAGVDVLDENGELREMGTIITEIGDK